MITGYRKPKAASKTGFNIKTIYFDVGFNNKATFYNAFKNSIVAFQFGIYSFFFLIYKKESIVIIMNCAPKKNWWNSML